MSLKSLYCECVESIAEDARIIGEAIGEFASLKRSSQIDYLLHFFLAILSGQIRLLLVFYSWFADRVAFPGSLAKPPGFCILMFTEFFWSKKIHDRVFVSIVSDMRDEYFEALSQKRIWKARWIRVRGTYSFFAAIGLDRAFAFVSFFIKAWKSVN